MATIDSNSTVEEIEAVYLDNLSYQTDSSATKAAAFIEACRALILRRPSRSSVGGSRGGFETDFDIAEIRRELAAAQRWLVANGTTASGASNSVRILSVNSDAMRGR